MFRTLFFVFFPVFFCAVPALANSKKYTQFIVSKNEPSVRGSIIVQCFNYGESDRCTINVSKRLEDDSISRLYFNGIYLQVSLKANESLIVDIYSGVAMISRRIEKGNSTETVLKAHCPKCDLNETKKRIRYLGGNKNLNKRDVVLLDGNKFKAKKYPEISFQLPFFIRIGSPYRSPIQTFASDIYEFSNGEDLLARTIDERSKSIQEKPRDRIFSQFRGGIRFLWSKHSETFVFLKFQLQFSMQNREYDESLTSRRISTGTFDPERVIAYGPGAEFRYNFRASNFVALGGEFIRRIRNSPHDPTALGISYIELVLYEISRVTLYWTLNLHWRIFSRLEYRIPASLSDETNTISGFIFNNSVQLPEATHKKAVWRSEIFGGVQVHNRILVGPIIEFVVSGRSPIEAVANRKHIGADPYDNVLFQGLRVQWAYQLNNEGNIQIFVSGGWQQYLTSSRNYTLEPALAELRGDELAVYYLDRTKNFVEVRTQPEQILRIGIEILSNSGVSR